MPDHTPVRDKPSLYWGDPVGLVCQDFPGFSLEDPMPWQPPQSEVNWDS